MEQAKSSWLQTPEAAGTVGRGLLTAAAVLLAAALSLAVALPAHAAQGGWRQDGAGWWYAYDDGGFARSSWEQVGGKWYHFDRFGYMDTGWELVGGDWYWLGSDGAMRTGWYTVDGEWQWSDASGVWHPSTWEYSNGRWWYSWADGTYPAGSWQLVDGEWYYFDNGGYMATGWQQVGPDWYWLGGSGAMATGWVKDGGGWYYLEPSGAMATGWKLVGDDWYFLRSGGSMVSNGWVDGTYWMGVSGAMATSEWVDGGRYYVDPDGEWVEGHEPITAPVTPASDFDYAVGDYILDGEVKTGKVPAGYTKMFGCALVDNPEYTYTDFNGGLKGSDCGHGVYITGYHGDSDTIVVPNEIGGLPVVYADFTFADHANKYDVSRCKSLKDLNLWGVLQLEAGPSSSVRAVSAQWFEWPESGSNPGYVDLSPMGNLTYFYVHAGFSRSFDMDTGQLEYIGGTNSGLNQLTVGDSPKLRMIQLYYSNLTADTLELGDCPELRFLHVMGVDLSSFTKADYPKLINRNGEEL